MSYTSIKNVSDFHEWLGKIKPKDKKGFVYRGQAKIKWQVNSSATRRLTKSSEKGIEGQLIDFPLVGYLVFLIAKARMRGFIPTGLSDKCADLELLAHLQHQGAATGLIDFTTQPLAALWFACNEHEKTDGAVYALPRSAVKEINERSDLEQEIKDFYGKDKPSLWQPSATDNRIVAQGSIFLFGVSCINLLAMQRIVVEAKDKKAVREELETVYGISEESLFSDFFGYATANAVYKDFDVERTIHYWKRQIDLISSEGESNETKAKKAEAHFNCGVAYSAIRKYEDAIQQYNKAKFYGLKNSAIYNYRGIARFEAGKAKEAIGELGVAKDCYREAIDDYDEAIKRHPKGTNIYNNRGVAKIELGAYEKAKEDFDKAIELATGCAPAYYNRGISWLCLKEWKKAKADLTIAKDIGFNIPKAFDERYTDIQTFQEKCKINKLPDDIVALLTSDENKS